MAYRTTIKTLRTLVDTLNDIAGMPRDPYVKVAEGVRAIEGCYVLDCAYGGYRLAQMVNEFGGERELTPRHNAGITADLIRAYMSGLREGKQPRFAQAA